MTSLLAWFAADDKPDGKRISSLTFASDSRMSWEDENRRPFDACRKVFASDTRPEIVAFAGEVDLIQQILLGFVSAAPVEGTEFDPYQRFAHVKLLIEAGINIYSRTPMSSTVFYGARTGIGPYGSDFHFFKLQWEQHSKTLSSTVVPVDHDSQSSTIHFDGTAGSGGALIRFWQDEWKKTNPNLHYTRHIFSAFCDAIASGHDRRTGGAPQLGTVRRHGNGILLGFVGGTGAYFKGNKLQTTSTDIAVEFMDANFQRVHRNGTLLKNAQRQPRPHEAPVPIRKITDIV